MAEACSYALGAPFDEVALAEHVGPLCLQIEPSKFLAKTLLRSSIIDAVLGKSLSLNVRRRHFESDWGQLCVTEDANPLSAIVAEFLETRKTLIAAQAAFEAMNSGSYSSCHVVSIKDTDRWTLSTATSGAALERSRRMRMERRAGTRASH